MSTVETKPDYELDLGLGLDLLVTVCLSIQMEIQKAWQIVDLNFIGDLEKEKVDI